MASAEQGGVVSVSELIRRASVAASPLAGQSGLVGRLRAFGVLMLCSVVLFGLRDLLAQPPALPWLLALKSMQIALAVWVLWALRRSAAARRPLGIAFVAACAWCVMVTASGILHGAAASYAFSLAAVLLCTATLVPWGGLPQTALAAVVVGLWAFGTWALDGWRALFQPTGFGLVGVAGASAYVACALRSMRAAIAEQTELLERSLDAARAAERERRRSAESFRALIEHADDLIAVLEADGVIRYVSPAVERLLGEPAERWFGRSAFDLTHPSDQATVVAHFAETRARSGTSTPVIFRVRHADGSWRTVEATGYNLLDADPLYGVVVNARDITERTEMERVMRESERRFRTLVENSSDLISQLDAQGAFRYASPNYGAALGYAPDEVVGHSTLEFIHPDDSARIAGALAEYRGGRHEFRFRHKSGEWRWFESHARPFIDERGELGAVVVSRDITERRRAAEELERARDAAEAASRAKSEFLANVSHEIRTPMNAVIGMTEIVLQSPLNAEQCEQLGLVKRSAESLLEVLNDILDFSKIEAGKLMLEPVDFDLAALLDDVVRALAVRAAPKGLRLTSRVAAGTPDWVTGDAGRLRQVLVNLIGNAVKFTDRGGIGVEVKGVAPSDGTGSVLLHCVVRDTGIGIAPDKQSMIFNAFEQADGSTTRRFGGTGLGLAICAQLVAMMGGRIWVESAPGEGSVFHFTARFTRARARPAVAPVAVAVQMPMRPLRVLLAEDNAINQKVATRMLTRAGHAVVVAGDGRAALDLVAREAFDVVLMDVQMPEMDGLQAAAAIRAREAGGTRRVPIVAMTAHAMKGDRERCRAAGMDAYVSKPVRGEELLATLSSVVREEEPTAQPAVALG